jgi:hypothetical protein
MNIEMWKSYARCWSLASEARAELLPQLTAEAVRYRDPYAEIAGREAFAAYMAGFQKGFPGHSFAIDDVAAHHDGSLARWRQVDGEGRVVCNGISYAAHDPDGRLREITGFFPQTG